MKELLELLDKADEMAAKLKESENKEKIDYHIKKAHLLLLADIERENK